MHGPAGARHLADHELREVLGRVDGANRRPPGVFSRSQSTRYGSQVCCRGSRATRYHRRCQATRRYGREPAVLDPDGFLGAHVLQLFSFPSGDPSEFDAFGPKEHAALEHMQWFQSVGGYNAMNSSRPQTIAAGLSDSPVGQLAYSELFESFGNGTSLVSPEQVLEQVTLYWLTNTAAGSVRYHFEEAHAQREPVVSTGRLGVAVFRHDFQTIRSLAERDNANIQHWSELDGGGHFAAMEKPDAVVADLRTFFGAVR